MLPSITNEVLKQVVAEFDAGELITMREQVAAFGKSPAQASYLSLYIMHSCINPCLHLLISHPGQVSARTNQELVTRAAQFGLILDDISITHLTFGRYQHLL